MADIFDIEMSLEQSAPLWVFDFEAFATGFMDQVGEATVETLREYAPKGATGQLDAGFYYTKDLGVDGFELRFNNTAPYTMMVVEGTTPHTITPVNAKALNWDDVFAAVVHHPGSQPNDFAQRALDDMTESLETSFPEAVAKNIT